MEEDEIKHLYKITKQCRNCQDNKIDLCHVCKTMKQTGTDKQYPLLAEIRRRCEFRQAETVNTLHGPIKNDAGYSVSPSKQIRELFATRWISIAMEIAEMTDERDERILEQPDP